MQVVNAIRKERNTYFSVYTDFFDSLVSRKPVYVLFCLLNSFNIYQLVNNRQKLGYRQAAESGSVAVYAAENRPLGR